MDVRLIRRILGAAILLLPSLSFAVMDDIVYGGDTRQVFGFDAYVDPFMISEAGMYEATLTDFEFPTSFDYIGFMVTEGATDKMGSIEGDGSFLFYADPGMYNAVFVGFVGESSFMDGFTPANIGTYGVQVALVPELETWLMMFLGLGAVIYWVRRNNKLVANREEALAVA